MSEVGDSRGLHLWLLRHAKAVSDPPPGGIDRDRTLAPRGRRDAAALAARLRAGDLGFGASDVPELVVASTAARTTETAERVATALGLTVDRRDRLYYGSPTDVLAEVRTLDDGFRSVMLVGHNPATHSLALELVSPGDGKARRALGSFPTCAIALLRVGISRWRDLAHGGAALEGFAHPPYAE